MRHRVHRPQEGGGPSRIDNDDGEIGMVSHGVV
jgi:hypothetical protein